MHNSRERVVGRSGHVNMVVRVNGLLATLLSPKNLNSAVRDDLVSVHVGLGTGAGLPDDEREVIKELALGNFGGSLLNGLSDLGVYYSLVSWPTSKHPEFPEFVPSPYFMLTAAAAPLRIPKALTTGGGMRS